MISRNEAFELLTEQIRDQIKESKIYLEDLINSRNSDTKSSAGDKYETGRSMMQQEIDRAEDRLSQLRFQMNELENIQKLKQDGSCKQGALVQIEEEYFLLGPGIGKLKIKDHFIFCISMASPLGQLLREKVEGDIIQFRGKPAKIKKIL